MEFYNPLKKSSPAKSSPVKKASPAKKSGGKKSGGKKSGGKKSGGKSSPAPAAKQQMPDWWIKCKRCGHVPRGTPQMACSSCKDVHSNWTPDPMAHIVKVANEVKGLEGKVKQSQANVAQLRTSNASLADEVRKLQTQIQDDEAAREQANLEKEALEIEKMGKGPGTKAREQTLVGNANRRRLMLKTRVDETEEELEDIEKQIAALQKTQAELKAKDAALERERTSLRADNDRLQTAVMNAHARR